MYHRLLIFVTKILIRVLRATGSSGSALPGLIMERLAPGFLYKTLQPVEKKIVLVTGTNGKTTTTKMLVHALRASGARVVTNGTGSNMTRGLISSLIDDMSLFGSLKPTDWFVFEMDEAYGPVFTKKVSPFLTIGLNVLRDQLDRYGEIDTTARLIGQTASVSDYFVCNSLDPLLVKQANQMEQAVVHYFGADDALLEQVANEQAHQGLKVKSHVEFNDERKTLLMKASEKNGLFNLQIKTETGSIVTTKLPLDGFHNALNAAAVASGLGVLLENSDEAVQSLESMEVPFGRGERLELQGKSITVALVKNPSGFATNLETFVSNAKPECILFVVNDKIADGRDVSWLWDVTFKGVVPENTKMYASGIRAYDMAVRLKQDGLKSEVDTSVSAGIKKVMQSSSSNVVIIPTYTALYEVREALGSYGKVPRIW